ncbi:hypothetical protein [uncultured Photobacterium sp.]|nr:hypothetical protein [uncultured Photobacterium sp.]
MITVDIPGKGNCQIEFLVLDFNRTLAFDSQLLETIELCLKATLRS